MTQRTLKLHGTLTIACLGFVASMAACLGDDSTEPPAHDAGTAADHAVTTDSPAVTPDTTSPRPDSAPDTSMAADARPDVSVGDGSTAPDGGVRDSAPEATTADARDSAPEAARETGPDSNPPVEASPGDARVDQVAEAAPPEAASPEAAPEAGDTALHMCGVFDEAYQVAQPDAGECLNATPPECTIDRSTTWSAAITDAFGTGEIFSDCHINGIFATLIVPDDYIDYGNYILAWNLAFLGCPDVDATPPPLTYGLIPAPLTAASYQFTNADLRLISHYYLVAIQQAHAAAPGVVPPLSQTQLDQIDAQLFALEQGVPGRVPVNTYSLDSCPPDAGSD